MDLTVARFDLDDRVRVRNTSRSTPRSATLPTGFPFLADYETGEVLEPALIFLADTHYGPASIQEGAWIRRHSADAAANDLRDWFTFLHEKGRDWDDVSERFMAQYLKSLKIDVSDATEDFLAMNTLQRRCSSIDEFHRFARDRWPSGKFPNTASARRIAGLGRIGRRQSGDDNAQPIDRENVELISERLGPLPRDRAEIGGSSKTRLAYEIGLTVGMRIDEVLNLRADDFANMDPEGRPNQVRTLMLVKTKGLVPREAYFPLSLVWQIQDYIAHERADSAARGEKALSAAGVKNPPNLLLNQPDAKGNAGKALRANTVQAEFTAAVRALKITRRRRKAIGTDNERVVHEPRHSFHDTRHTFAYWKYLSFVEQGHKTPWIEIRDLLGHAQLQTTVDVYLKAFNALGAETLEHLAASFDAIRKAHKK
jgi:integrase